MNLRPLPRVPFESKLAWRVIAVCADGSGLGNCGHNHRSKEAAVACPWTPDPWPDRCDLLVRQVRKDVPRR